MKFVIFCLNLTLLWLSSDGSVIKKEYYKTCHKEYEKPFIVIYYDTHLENHSFTTSNGYNCMELSTQIVVPHESVIFIKYLASKTNYNAKAKIFVVMEGKRTIVRSLQIRTFEKWTTFGIQIPTENKTNSDFKVSDSIFC